MAELLDHDRARAAVIMGGIQKPGGEVHTEDSDVRLGAAVFRPTIRDPRYISTN
jgi:hypothetical protein